jgi:hypothetical protein
MDLLELAYDVSPQLLALLLVFFSPSVESFINTKAAGLCEELTLKGLFEKAMPIDDRDPNAAKVREAEATAFVTRCTQYVTHFAVSAIALSDQFASILSFFFGVALIFHTWPAALAYPLALASLALFGICFWRFFYNIGSLKLHEISTDKVPGRSAPKRYTWATLFQRQQILFNVLLIVIIAIGAFCFPTSGNRNGVSASHSTASNLPNAAKTP